jgi:hypothetical protein
VLFGVSILEDTLFYRVSNVKSQVCMICKFSTFTFEYISLKKITRKSCICYWISDSETCQRLIDLRYEILLYHIIIASIDPIYSFYLVAFGLLWLLKFEFVRARFILNYFYFISMPSGIS